MNFNKRILLIFALLIPSTFLSAQNAISELSTFYEVTSDPSEVAEIRRKCLLETEGQKMFQRSTLRKVISLTKLKALLQDRDPQKNYDGLLKIGNGLVQDLQPADAELIQLVSSFLGENDDRQAKALEALCIVDPKNAASKIIEVLEQDNLPCAKRMAAKQLLGKTTTSQETIDYLKGLLSQENRSVFELEDNAAEVMTLIALYEKGTINQREEIFDFVTAYGQKHSDVFGIDMALRLAWSKNPVPKYLDMMEDIFANSIANGYYIRGELLPGILKLKGKRGDRLVYEIWENSVSKFYEEILIWAHENQKAKIQERILSAMTTEEYASPTQHLRNVWAIGGQEMVDQYLSYSKDVLNRPAYQKFVELHLAPIRKLHPLRQFADTLFQTGFLETPISNSELEALRSSEDNNEESLSFLPVIERLPCYYQSMEYHIDYSRHLDEVLIPVANGALDGLELLEYTSPHHSSFSWLYFKGKAYRYLSSGLPGEYSVMAADAHYQFYSLNFLLELYGVKERFYKIPKSDLDDLKGGFYTTQEKARALFSLIGRTPEPWKQ